MNDLFQIYEEYMKKACSLDCEETKNYDKTLQ